MKNNPLPSQPSEQSERADRPAPQVDASLSAEKGGQEQLDILMKDGFAWDQALKLIYLRDHLYSNSEMQQRLANDQRMQFMRWLYEQGELKEE
jgi:hypothetical protein